MSGNNNNKSMMKAVRIHVYGNSDVLRYEDAEVPQVNGNDVLVRVEYAGVNPMDWKVREGYFKEAIPLKMPATLGMDFAGTVEKVGDKVKRFKPGDKVFSRADFTRGGSYAEYVAVDANQPAHVPKSLSVKEAAAVPVAYGTAYNGLFTTAGLRSGHKVLITGASGGVGIAAVQLAKSAGAYVVGTTSAANVPMVKSLGADKVIDYTSADFSKQVSGMDIVFDTVGRDTMDRAYSVLKKGGVIVSTAGQPNASLEVKYGVVAKPLKNVTDGKLLEDLARLFDTGKLKVVLEKEFAMSEIKAAHDLSQSRKARGKIVVRVK